MNILYIGIHFFYPSIFFSISFRFYPYNIIYFHFYFSKSLLSVYREYSLPRPFGLSSSGWPVPAHFGQSTTSLLVLLGGRWPSQTAVEVDRRESRDRLSPTLPRVLAVGTRYSVLIFSAQESSAVDGSACGLLHHHLLRAMPLRAITRARSNHHKMVSIALMHHSGKH